MSKLDEIIDKYSQLEESEDSKTKRGSCLDAAAFLLDFKIPLIPILTVKNSRAEWVWKDPNPNMFRDNFTTSLPSIRWIENA